MTIHPEHITIFVPPPPSANRMFGRRLTKRGKRLLTPEYMAWRDSAGWEAKRQLIGVPRIDGRFDVSIEVPVSRKDLDNHVKPLLDLCQRVGLISNDGNTAAISIVPADRADCVLRFTERPDLGGVRPAAKPVWRTSGPVKGKPSAARIAKAHAAGVWK